LSNTLEGIYCELNNVPTSPSDIPNTSCGVYNQGSEEILLSDSSEELARKINVVANVVVPCATTGRRILADDDVGVIYGSAGRITTTARILRATGFSGGARNRGDFDATRVAEDEMRVNAVTTDHSGDDTIWVCQAAIGSDGSCDDRKRRQGIDESWFQVVTNVNESIAVEDDRCDNRLFVRVV
jgi:hypothetical protein